MTTWKITITDSGGTTYTPDIYDPPETVTPAEIPEANGVPTLRFGVLPLSGSDSWFDAKFENADITVEKDANDDGTFTTEPYSTLTVNSSASGEGVVVLEAEGGDELDKRVDESFGVVETHNAAEQVVAGITSYGTDIPTPSTTTTTAATVRDRSSGVISGDLQPQKDISPAHVNGSSELTYHQTLHFYEPSTTLSTVNDTVSWTFTTNYAIPEGQVGMALLATVSDLNVILECSIDGTVIGEMGVLEPTALPGVTIDDWAFVTAPSVRLEPGTHTARFEVVGETFDGIDLDSLDPQGVCVYDNRFNYDFDSDLVNGPQLYPADVQNTHVSLTPGLTTQAVTGVAFNGTYQDGVGPEITVGTNDQTQTGFGDQDADFTDRGVSAQVEVGFKAYGSDSTKTPESGFKVTTIQSYQLNADLETMPMIVDEDYQGTVAETLTELGETLRGDFVWTYDSDSSGNKIVRFVRAGSRSTTNNDVEDYAVDKDASTILEEIKVIGSVVEQAGEGIRVQHGTAVDLQQNNLIEGSESVERDGKVYERGRHYAIDYDAGTITADSNPARAQPIPDGGLVSVSYAYRPQSVVTKAGVSSPTRTATIDELPLRSDAACELAADQILSAAQSPTFTAEATLRGDAVFSAVEELDASRIPGPAYEVTSISAAPAGTLVRLENQQQVNDVIGDVRDDLESIARHIR